MDTPGGPTWLDGDGYLVARLLDDDDLAELRQAYAELAVPDEHGFFASSVHAERGAARRVDALVKERLGAALGEVLPDHEPFLGAFISKGPIGWNSVELHQDWTYTLEPAVRAVIVWCPLLDAAPGDGALHLIPGSHRWSERFRGSGATPSPLAEVAAGLEASPLVRRFDLPAGTGLLYDAALLHGSAPNDGASVRAAAALALAPRGAQLVHYHQEEGGPIEGYLIDEAFYTTQDFGGRPQGYRRLDVDPDRFGVHAPDELAAVVAGRPPA